MMRLVTLALSRATDRLREHREDEIDEEYAAGLVQWATAWADSSTSPDRHRR